MKQEQSIGSNNQQQGMPDQNKKEQTRPQGNSHLKPGEPQPEKPEVTNDAGNRVDRETKDSGKGYNEKKPTESWDQVKIPGQVPASVPPSQQEKSTEKVYSENPTRSDEADVNKHREYPHQANHEHTEDDEKRIRQSGNVAG